jgi:hypothetical protein
MRRSIVGVLVLVVAAGSTLTVLCQEDAAASKGPNEPQVPYRAEFKDTTVNRLGDGAIQTLESNEVLAADSKGRTMFSHNEKWPPGKKRITGLVTRVIVSDPLAGTRMTWTLSEREATVTRLLPDRPGCFAFNTPMQEAFLAAGGGANLYQDEGSTPRLAGASIYPFGGNKGTNNSSVAVEDLGATTIEGVEAHGTRTTWTASSEVPGNHVPRVSVQEVWVATTLGPDNPILREVFDNPPYGTTTLEPVSLSLEEPDVSTFQPPQGYKVVRQDLQEGPCPAEPSQNEPKMPSRLH